MLFSSKLLRSALFLLLFAFFIPVVPSTAANVRNYGVVGDGITDDTEAIQYALNHSRKLFFPEGSYLITKPLVVVSGHRLSGEKSVFVLGKEDAMIRVRGNKITFSDIEIDGNGKAVHGLWIEDGKKISIKNCRLHHFYGTSKDQSNAIYLASGCKKVIIDGCVISDVDAPLNGKIGDLYGSCQGILAMKVADCQIKNCIFDNVKSIEDGDCIQVFSGRINGNQTWDEGSVRIENCSFNNIWHRAIKLQTSNSHVSNCTITADSSRRPSAAIEVFGNNCSVSDCSVVMDFGVHAITVSGNSFSMSGCTMSIDENRRHTEELKKLHADIIYCIGKDCVFENNTIIGSYIGFYSPSSQNGLRIKKNSFSSSTLRNIRIYNGKEQDILIEGNVFQGTNVTIEMASGEKVKIMDNKMLKGKSSINILGRSFSGTIKGNTVEGAQNVGINYVAN